MDSASHLQVSRKVATPGGTVARFEFYPALFRSHARLTYTEVWAKLSARKADASLATLYDVFEALYAATS